MRTYLPQNIQRHIGIIPDVPVHDEVVKNSDCKLNGSDYHCADKAAADKRHGMMTVYGIEYGENCSAGKGHRPVRVAAVEYFNKAVHKITHEKSKCILRKLHCRTPFYLIKDILDSNQGNIHQIEKSTYLKSDNKRCKKCEKAAY